MGRPREFNESLVVERAVELFWTKGYRRTTPNDILTATGLSKSSLYNTFNSKKGLFVRAIDRYAEQNAQQLKTFLAEKTLRKALRRMYDGLLAAMKEDASRSCLICTASIEVDPLETALVARIQTARLRIRDVLADRIRQARDEGEIEADKDPIDLAAFVINNNMGIMVQARAGASAVEQETIIRQVIAAVCD